MVEKLGANKTAQRRKKTAPTSPFNIKIRIDT